MKYPKFFLPIILSSYLLVGGELAIMFIFRTNLPETIPLFYSLPWGNQQLAPKDWFFIIPSISLLICLVNTILSIIIVKKGEKFIATILASFALIVSILGIITVGRIVGIMT